MPSAPGLMMKGSAATEGHDGRHLHRTAKVIELIGSSRTSFDDAIRTALRDASATTRGISGVEIDSMTIKCEEGTPVEYKVSLKVAFGIERTDAV